MPWDCVYRLGHAALMHFETSSGLHAGSADLPVRSAPGRREVFVSKIDYFRTSRSVRTRRPRSQPNATS